MVDDPHVVLQEERVVAHHGVTVVAPIQLLVAAESLAGEGVTHQVLLTDDDELTGGPLIAMLEKVQDRLVERLVVECNVAVGVCCERIEAELLESWFRTGAVRSVTACGAADTCEVGNDADENG